MIWEFEEEVEKTGIPLGMVLMLGADQFVRLVFVLFSTFSHT